MLWDSYAPPCGDGVAAELSALASIVLPLRGHGCEYDIHAEKQAGIVTGQMPLRPICRTGLNHR